MKKNKTIIQSVQVILFLLFSLFCQSILAEVVVIVNAESEVSSAKKKEIKKIFLGKSKKISEMVMKPIDNTSKNTRKIFLKSVVGKSPRAFKSYWTRLVFSGKSAPLKSGGDDKDIISWISNHKNGIGFIDSKNIQDSVKIIYTID